MITVKVICDNQGKITQNNQRKPKKIEQHTEADSKQQVVLKKQRVFLCTDIILWKTFLVTHSAG